MGVLYLYSSLCFTDLFQKKLRTTVSVWPTIITQLLSHLGYCSILIMAILLSLYVIDNKE